MRSWRLPNRCQVCSYWRSHGHLRVPHQRTGSSEDIAAGPSSQGGEHYCYLVILLMFRVNVTTGFTADCRLPSAETLVKLSLSMTMSPVFEVTQWSDPYLDV
eukprot:gnl/MRDRNA2_/MRDRNA2_85249_c0_seq2.p1 gnl/MRDRNA2_/MRDRNA2_85249_c0~~gnl/MRDRNA2_/MRDRNA2_85249_c0_seq2.p1  ORF type:complete len:102 (-),score=1.68 gnl/MRDRNA2_/MRDRNA2_85249_c0_seq2:66-371(-)